MIDRVYKINPALEQKIAVVLKQKFAVDIFEENFPNSAGARRIAQAIIKLSDYYIASKFDSTPWLEPWCQLAYLSYYMVLNELRCRAVISEAKNSGFLNSIQQVTDFGAGLGAATFGLAEILPQSTQYVHIERSAAAQALHKMIFPHGRWTDLPSVPEAQSLGVFSYSLNELEVWPEWMQQFENLLIVEPATSQQGRVLLENRQKLIDKGFHIWAPCTHQGLCPLLTKSKNDWCHDRIIFSQPTWFAGIEQHLPMRNQSLTFSYLLASKKPAPAKTGLARITGDLLNEKGKSRQLVCRNSEREFLTWMHKNSEVQTIPRGVLIEWPKQFEAKSNEIRVTQNISILDLDKSKATEENKA